MRSRIEVIPSGCWNWLGSHNGDGYGKVNFAKRRYLTHRVSYELLVGKIPEGLQIDHLCRNKSCCNPAHLEVVTRTENLQRQAAAKVRATCCKWGHELTDENTISRRNPKTGRIWAQCRTCKNEGKRARRKALNEMKAA
jgi:hypothetical protein